MTDYHVPFMAMAKDIAATAETSTTNFAGAIVIVPPGDAAPIAFHTWAAKPNAFQFWTNLKSLVEEACANAQAEMMAGREQWQLPRR